MRRLYWIGFPLLLCVDSVAHLCFKLAGARALPLDFSLAWLQRLFAQPFLYGAVLGYVGAFFIWITLLERAPIGPAFAASHLDVVGVLVLSAWWLGEPLTAVHLLGAALILAGVACLARAEARLAADGD
ncbi:TPA: EamA family transporter [Xanthomonas vasicola pv. zeae]|uniref:Membrane protein n=3 Tax=Xanthomonas vasicola TaxID=56459 RepID=A0A836P6E5_XANVA|nr:EamA family transporter [Xanthomonas vasicola]AVQ08723.1 EamA family transporter [Xanthomonas vasicola pv. vasculorum]AZM72971.1 EamA family transporter [Xanthomonas vasicola pv. vasculorum]AZR28612.1 EamA family transporter [Xanthomonas vasicola pv. arecae]KFA23852.1 membrane protein [Xanthomonas vasicola pv. vasculorum NCPPB 1326]KFA34155.1 membrane protein [Xanthomonas vasicola pv. vasculorum NCPPB 1381]